MRAWFQVKTHKLHDIRIAVVVDRGEPEFSAYRSTLGAPGTRYFGPGETEVRRQWIVCRRANRQLFRALYRELRGKDEGEVVEVASRVHPRQRPATPVVGAVA